MDLRDDYIRPFLKANESKLVVIANEPLPLVHDLLGNIQPLCIIASEGSEVYHAGRYIVEPSYAPVKSFAEFVLRGCSNEELDYGFLCISSNDTTALGVKGVMQHLSQTEQIMFCDSEIFSYHKTETPDEGNAKEDANRLAKQLKCVGQVCTTWAEVPEEVDWVTV